MQRRPPSSTRTSTLFPYTTPSRSAARPGWIGGWSATSWPDRVARQRAGQRGEYLSVGGRAYRIDPVDPLAGSEWLAITDAQGHAAGVRILSAAPIDQAEVEALFADYVVAHSASSYDAAKARVDHTRERRRGGIALTGGRGGGGGVGRGGGWGRR